MVAKTVELTSDEQVVRAKELYHRLITPDIEMANWDRVVAIDTQSEDFEIGDNMQEVFRRLKDRQPQGRILSFLVGGVGNRRGRGPVKSPAVVAAERKSAEISAAVIGRGHAIYDRRIRPELESENRGQFVAIDVNSEQFEIGDDLIEICRRLRARQPDAQVALIRIGGGGIDRLGYHPHRGRVMIQGAINARFEPALTLTLLDQADNPLLIDASIDTGFSGFVALPPALVVHLALPTAGPGNLTLAGGLVVRRDYYHLRLEWDGFVHTVFAVELDGEPLIGMSLLRNYRVEFDAIVGGDVTVTPSPSPRPAAP